MISCVVQAVVQAVFFDSYLSGYKQKGEPGYRLLPIKHLGDRDSFLFKLKCLTWQFDLIMATLFIRKVLVQMSVSQIKHDFDANNPFNALLLPEKMESKVPFDLPFTVTSCLLPYTENNMCDLHEKLEKEQIYSRSRAWMPLFYMGTAFSSVLNVLNDFHGDMINFEDVYHTLIDAHFEKDFLHKKQDSTVVDEHQLGSSGLSTVPTINCVKPGMENCSEDNLGKSSTQIFDPEKSKLLMAMDGPSLSEVTKNKK